MLPNLKYNDVSYEFVAIISKSPAPLELGLDSSMGEDDDEFVVLLPRTWR